MTSLLIDRWNFEKEYLPKGKLSRWDRFHYHFPLYDETKQENRERCCATEAAIRIKECGPKSRERWIEEYRHQRVLRGILEDKEYPNFVVAPPAPTASKLASLWKPAFESL